MEKQPSNIQEQEIDNKNRQTDNVTIAKAKPKRGRPKGSVSRMKTNNRSKESASRKTTAIKAKSGKPAEKKQGSPSSGHPMAPCA